MNINEPQNPAVRLCLYPYYIINHELIFVGCCIPFATTYCYRTVISWRIKYNMCIQIYIQYEIRAFLFVYLRFTTPKVLKCRNIVEYKRNMILQFLSLRTMFAMFAYSAIIYHVNSFTTTFIIPTNIFISLNKSIVHLGLGSLIQYIWSSISLKNSNMAMRCFVNDICLLYWFLLVYGNAFDRKMHTLTVFCISFRENICQYLICRMQTALMP